MRRDYKLAQQMLNEWYAEYMDVIRRETLRTLQEVVPEWQSPSLSLPPSDPGYPGAYSLPEVLDAMSPGTELSDADWLEQNRRVNTLLRRGVDA